MTALPLYKRPWKKLTPRQKMLREKSLAVIGELRNSKTKTLPQAANDNDITVKNVIKHTNGFKKVLNNFLAIISKVSILRSVIKVISTIFKTVIKLQKTNQILTTLSGSS